MGWFVNSPTYMQAVVDGDDVKFTNTNVGTNDKSNGAAYAAGGIYLNTNSFFLTGGFENSINRHNRGISFQVDPANVEKFGSKMFCNAKPPKAAVTSSPTVSPTDEPTKAPTKAPTDEPTKAPTKSPTDEPTKAPTKAPTKSPVTTSPVLAGDTKSGDRDLPPDNKCIETNWKDAGNTEELLCATRDVFLASARSEEPLQCSAGDKVKVKVDGSIRFRDALPRYDVAWYVATDGGDAMTGTCALTALGKTAEGYSVVAAPGSDKVVGSVAWDAASDGDGDTCGDVVFSSATDGGNLDAFVVDLELPCDDDNEDGLLDFAVCFTWRLDCNNDVCSFDAVIPGNPTTGCYCTRVDVTNTEVDVPITVEPC